VTVAQSNLPDVSLQFPFRPAKAPTRKRFSPENQAALAPFGTILQGAEQHIEHSHNGGGHASGYDRHSCFRGQPHGAQQSTAVHDWKLRHQDMIA
jgi:hypothetical protein